MAKHEQGEKERVSTPVIEIPEDELSWRTEVDALGYILSKLQAESLYRSELLFCGFDGAALLTARRHADIEHIYALSEEEYLEQSKKEDSYGGDTGGTPLQFARREADTQPVIGVYDSRLLVRRSASSTLDELEEESLTGLEQNYVPRKDLTYIPQEDSTFDDALVTIIKLV